MINQGQNSNLSSHIVIIPHDISSKLNPTYELAHLLQKAGNRITIIGNNRIQETAEIQGFEFFTAGVGWPKFERFRRKQNPLKFIYHPEKQMDALVEEFGLQGFTDLLNSYNPDLILIDVEQHSFIISSVPTGIRVALLSSLVSLYKCPGLPPAHLSVVPGVGLKGTKLGIEFLWLSFRLKKWRNRFTNYIRHGGMSLNKVFRHLARRTGFDFRKEVDFNQWMIPFVYPNLPLLSFMTPEFDFPHTPPTNYNQVGALINTDRREVVQLDDPSDAKRLNNLLTYRQNTPYLSKLIYCSFGAYFKGNDTYFWLQLAQAFSKNTDWCVIFGLGGRLKPSKLGELPPNIHAFRWVPQLRVLRLADCAIIHGGITSINECIASGVPMVVYPFDVTDQHGAAARVNYHKLGIVGDRHQDDSNTIRSHVERIIDDTTYVSRVKKMREYFERNLSENTAVKSVKAILKQSEASNQKISIDND